jgi:hypothetical protein
MRIGDVVALTRETCVASTNYDVYPVKLENFALVDITRIASLTGESGTPKRKRFFSSHKRGKG